MFNQFYFQTGSKLLCETFNPAQTNHFPESMKQIAWIDKSLTCHFRHQSPDCKFVSIFTVKELRTHGTASLVYDSL